MEYLTAQGWLMPEERELLYSLAAQLPSSSTIINIGVEYGASMACLMAGARDASVRVIGIDPDLSKYVGRPSILLLGRSQDFGLAWDQGPVQFVFVDGDHSYDGVADDIRAWTPHIVRDGWIAFHDCYAWEGDPKEIHHLVPEVDRAVGDWFATVQDTWHEEPFVRSIRVFRRQ